jgi:hypothetical protein
VAIESALASSVQSPLVHSRCASVSSSVPGLAVVVVVVVAVAVFRVCGGLWRLGKGKKKWL